MIKHNLNKVLQPHNIMKLFLIVEVPQLTTNP